MSSKPRFHLSPVVVATLSCFLPTMAVANPLGATVVAGQATFNQAGSLLTISNTPGTIINWNQFSIASGETTRFNQINAQSAVLNRVTGQDPSQILGRLESNGRVYLVNPNGILFGQGSVVDVAGLIASSLNLSDADFLNGKIRLTGTAEAGAVTNLGRIQTPDGGQVLLVAPTVSNQGVIENRNGEIFLVAGQSVELVDSTNTALRVKVEAGGEAVNLGQIIAASGKAGIFAATLTQSGKVSANRAEYGPNGEVVFKASGSLTLTADSTTQAAGGSVLADSSAGKLTIAGLVDASSDIGQGGKLELTGQQVEAAATAALLANGEQGGTVLLGGDFQGKNAAVHNASTTYFARGARISADGTSSSGGKVIVWADDRTAAYGSISAQGKTTGGFAEVSGKQGLAFGADVNLQGENGESGTLLLDPMSIVIDANGSTATLDPASLISNTSDSLTVAASALENISGNLVLQASYSVTVNDALNLTASHSKSLSITAGDANTAGQISINADIVTDHSGGISLTTLGGAVSPSSILLAGGVTSTGGGAIKLDANVVSLLNSDTAGSIDAGSGDVIIGTPTNTGSIVKTLTLAGSSSVFIKGRSLYLEADNGLDVSGGANLKATSDIVVVTGNGTGLTMSNGGYIEAPRIALAVDKFELTTQSPSEKLLKATEHLSLTGGRGERWNPTAQTIDVTLGGSAADTTSMMVVSDTDFAAIDSNNIRIGLVDSGSPITGQYGSIAMGGNVDLTGKLLALSGTGNFSAGTYSLTANGIAANFDTGISAADTSNPSGLLRAANINLVASSSINASTDADHLSARLTGSGTINVNEVDDVQSVALGIESGSDSQISFSGTGNVGSFFAGYKTGTANVTVTASGNLGVYGIANGSYVSLTSTNGQIGNAAAPAAMAAMLNGGTYSRYGVQASSLALSAAQSIAGLDIATTSLLSATSTNGSVGLNASGWLSAGTISAAGDVGIAAKGYLYTGNITAGTGRSVVLLSGGNLYQNSGSTIQATDGLVKLLAKGEIGLATVDAGTGKVELIAGGKIGATPLTASAMPISLPTPQAIVTLAPNVLAGSLYAVSPVSINLTATVPSANIKAISPSGQVIDTSGNVIAVATMGQFASDIQGSGFTDVGEVKDKLDEDALNRERKSQEQRKREEEERLGKRKKAKKC